MNPKSLLLWAGVILLIAYVMDINVGHVINSIISGLQQMHQANAH